MFSLCDQSLICPTAFCDILTNIIEATIADHCLTFASLENKSPEVNLASDRASSFLDLTSREPLAPEFDFTGL